MNTPRKRKTTYKGSLFTVTHDTFVTPANTQKTYERVFRVPSVYVLPMLDEHTIILLREFRISQGKYLWRIPAGRVDKEMDYDKRTIEKLLNPPARVLRAAAQRELQEEAGYKAKQLKRVYKRFMGESIQAPTWVFMAKDLTPAKLPQDDDEKILVRPTPLKDAYELAINGKIGEELMALMIIRLYKKTL